MARHWALSKWTYIREKTSPHCKRYDPEAFTEWQDFRSFRHWLENELGPPPEPDSMLTRIDSRGGFVAGNLCWGNHQTRCDRSRLSRNVQIGDEIHSLSEWCRRYGVSYVPVLGRVLRGWDPVTALTTPIDFRYSRYAKVQN